MVPKCLVLLALGAASDELCDSFIHLWPPEISSYQLDGFILTHMTGDFRVVFGRQYRVDEVFVLRDPEHTLTIEQPILDSENRIPTVSIACRYMESASPAFSTRLVNSSFHF
jgi:hypothetical protein